MTQIEEELLHLVCFSFFPVLPALPFICSWFAYLVFISLCLLSSMAMFLWSVTIAEQGTVMSWMLLKHTIACLTDIRAASRTAGTFQHQWAQYKTTPVLLSFKKKPLKFSLTSIKKSSRQCVITKHELTNSLQMLER